MSLEPLSIKEMESQSADIYETVVVMSKRVHNSVATEDTYVDQTVNDEMGVYDELVETNPEDYEELEKPTTVSVNEFIEGDLDWKNEQEDS